MKKNHETYIIIQKKNNDDKKRERLLKSLDKNKKKHKTMPAFFHFFICTWQTTQTFAVILPSYIKKKIVHFIAQ